MHCSAVTSKLNRYLENALSAPDAQAVAQHLTHCTDCKSTVDEMRQLQTVFSNNTVDEMPERITANLYRSVNIYRFHKNETKETLFSWFSHAPFHTRVAFSCVTLLAGVIGILMSYDIWMAPSGSTAQAAAEPTDKIYQLDAFNSRSNGSLYTMYTDMVFVSDERVLP